MNTQQMKKKIMDGGIDECLRDALSVPERNVPTQRVRYAEAVGEFEKLYGDGEITLYSVGGRSEISGNHTDHNHGKVIAAAVNLDILAVVKPEVNGVVRVKSQGFPEDTVSPDEVDAPDPQKYFTSAAIIAGMQKAFLNAGYNIGGFSAYTTSNVLKGSGISSSAAFEVMIGNILNHLYNDGKVPNVEIAKMAQFAENTYFGKPCGLMDQTACAVGGFITIDFQNPAQPVIEKLDFDLTKAGYALCIVNTGGNHADLNEDYASVPAEMKKVAAALGVGTLRETSRDKLDKLLTQKSVREELGDRAILRAYHFFAENERVEMQVNALKAGDVDTFFDGVERSGSSSFRFLQNVYTTKNVREQGLSLALCLTEEFLRGLDKRGVCRVHGGGFAGTIQAFIPLEYVDGYAEKMNSVFGEGACHILSVRRDGAKKIL